MDDTGHSSDIPFPPRLVRVDLPDDRALSIIVDGEAGAFEIAWEVVLTFAASGDPFPKAFPTSRTITEIGMASAFLDYARATYADYADPSYIAVMGRSEPTGERPLRHWH